MFKAIKYVVSENVGNIYRIFTISRYTITADIHDSKLGLFWNFANPLIQVMTYWFLFGIVFQRKAVGDIPYLPWMLTGMAVWFFLSPCITNGCNAIFQKSGVISKMKFPVSILPATVIFVEFFNHVCFMLITIIGLLLFGFYPSIYWLELIYYMAAAIFFAISLALVTSVLNMIARDVRKFVLAIMRLLLYLTPILWDIKTLPKNLQFIMKCNPIFYIVTGYRDCFFYHRGILFYHKQMALFFAITLTLFVIGSTLMYRFKTRFIDLL